MHAQSAESATRANGAKLRALSIVAVLCGQICGAQDSPARQSPTELKPFGAVSKNLLLFKYAPGHFSDEDLLRRAVLQVRMDQQHYQGHHFVSMKWPHSQPMFSRAAVEGRDPEFVARELLDEYRRKLTERAARLPSRYAGVIGLNSQQAGQVQFDHQRSVIRHSNHEAYMLRPPRISDVEAGEYDVYGTRLAMSISAVAVECLKRDFGFGYVDEELQEATPTSMAEDSRPPRSRGVYLLALDRRPELPAWPISAAKAEHFFTRPSSRQELAKYYGEFMLFFDMEIEDVATEGRYFIFQAKLLGGTLLGTRGELLVKYQASDFPSVVSIREEQAEATRLAATREKRAQQEEEEAVLGSLADLEILGVGLGSLISEAEATLRKEQKIETVYDLSPPPPPRHGSPRFNPYQSGRIFVANGGNDVITLFVGGEDEVIGISRSMKVDDGLTREVLGQLLAENYGEPTTEGRNVWIWGDIGKASHCAGQGVVSARSKLQLAEGKPIDNITYDAVGISVRDKFPKDSFAKCHPVLHILSNLPDNIVEFRLYDHSLAARSTIESEEQ